MNLNEWAILYLRHRDSFKKNIIEILDEKNRLIIKYKDRTEECMIYPELDQLNIEKKDSPVLIITLNKRKNADHLIKNWKLFSNFEKLKIIFINPDKNVFWIISPHIHNKICDDSSLSLGIISMHESVETI
ncbi:MAG: hypothetical protein KKF44_08560 [Nanoarchaeota archaeon]|nr:hypothetical protein [Nanoarchaeota archaeon]